MKLITANINPTNSHQTNLLRFAEDENWTILKINKKSDLKDIQGDYYICGTNVELIKSIVSETPDKMTILTDCCENLDVADLKCKLDVSSNVCVYYMPGDASKKCRMIYNILPPELLKKIDVENMGLSELRVIGGAPRLQAFYGTCTGKGKSTPLYRSPVDVLAEVTDWENTFVKEIGEFIGNKFNEPINQGVVQLYRDGKDNIGKHSDKTIDILRNSTIFNLSFGADRIFTLSPKDDPDDEQQILMINNSLFVLDWDTNNRYLHGIPRDFNVKGKRVSITYRSIGTFFNNESKKIVGQGAAKGKTGMSKGELAKAFSKQNYTIDPDWYELYSRGSNELTIRN